MFSPRLVSSLKRLLPSSLYKRLDPFETAIESFVRTVAAEIPAGKRVLDAGSGEGRFKPLFLHAEYVGIDSTQGDPSWDYSKVDVIGRLEELPFRNVSFDHILSIVVLEHTPQPARVVEEFLRVLKPGGLTIFSGSPRAVFVTCWREGVSASTKFSRSADSFGNLDGI